ncbi:carbohydrate-binding domain-containing protein [Paenibacillus sp. VCA1]|uniref:carbohydrate-binding domain-containing protein n=1 Tax=Paenibacillus sp. VCA1 TaxID=3039148 RepID=UPI0028722DBA|nr:carbohydrate-binding domain-containing protein [Paenibacillus sp. VCA1]MDR9853215.1 carbohydrate-binding domain-containing protein [Paenibacillus sp. VCA1]
MKPSYKNKFAAILILSAMLASGCTTNAAGDTAEADGTAAETTAAAVDAGKANAQLASLKIKDLVEYDSDDTSAEWTASDAAAITLNGTGAAVNGSGAKASGGDVTISSAGTYVISGKLQSGSIVVDAGKDDVVHLVLNGAQIVNPDGPAIQVKKAGKTVLTLNEGTSNTLSDGKTYADTSEDAPTAALYSKDDLTINGTGKLTVQANYKDGITSKDNLKIVSGTLDVNAADDGIVGRDLAAVKAGTVHVNAGGDGFKTTYDGDKDKGYLVIEDGTFAIESGSDGFQAAASLLIAGGTYDVVTGGGSANAEPHEEEMPMWRPDFGGQPGSGGQNGRTAAQATDGGANADSAKDSTAAASNAGSQAKDDGANAESGISAGKDDAQAANGESESKSMKGLKAEAGISVSGGTFGIDSADDSVHSNGSILVSGGRLDLATGDDGIHADVSIVISGGKVNVKNSYEGIEAADILISGGEIHVVSSDDGVNAADGSGSGEGPGGMFGGEPPAGMPGQAADQAAGGRAQSGTTAQTGGSAQPSSGTAPSNAQANGSGQAAQDGSADQSGAQQRPDGQGMPGGPGGSAGNAKLTISGGYLTVNAQGDGLDANGSITMTGGTVLVNGPTSGGNGALDYDGTFEQSGGLLVAAGSAGMAQAPSESSPQRSVLMTFPSTVKAGTLVTLADGKGTPILSFAPAKDIQTIVISTPDLKSGYTYAFYTGGKSSGSAKDGLYTGGKLTGGTKVVSFKLGDAVTYVNESGVTTGGGGRGPGRPGGFRNQGDAAANGAPAQSGSGGTQTGDSESSTK